MKAHKSKTVLAAVLALVMMTTTMSPAFAALQGDIDSSQEQTQAYTYVAPEQTMEIDDSIITASAHRAASPILGMLGVNATSGFGMINGGAPADFDKAQSSAALGIWGSSLNESPDPYYWNYFYNYYAAENGLPLSEDALLNTNAAASPVGADSTLLPEYGNVSISLYTRPDILVGCASSNSGTDVSGYDDQLATIHSFTKDSPYYQEGDETYSPKLISYQTTTIKEMIWSVHQLADAISEVEAETGKTTRYGDVQQIAQDYENYVYGIIAYVQQQLEAKGLDQKTVAVITAINEDGTYTLADSISRSATSLVRAYEYTMTTCNSLVDEIGGTVATLDQLLSADAIVTINNQNINQTTLLESFGEKTYDGILITNTPSTLYGMTMNSVENAMGYAYVIGSIYSDVIDIDPVELCAYFYQHFWHISDLDSLATVVKTNFASTILPDGVSATLTSTYSEAKIQKQIDSGIAYLNANPGKFVSKEYAKIGMGNTTDYTDVPTEEWYYEAVQYMTVKGLFEGTGNNAFAPTKEMTMAELVQVLYRVANGKTPETVPGGNWYDTARDWAVAAGLVSADGFKADANVTREDFILMFYNCVKKIGSYDMTVTADITGATDYASLNPENLTAISWAVGSGMIIGTNGSVLTIAPNTEVNRATVCTMLMRYYKGLN
ncbi:MAG: S-layer homology domain-containing protein [Oscillospiraceae bacterium]